MATSPTPNPQDQQAPGATPTPDAGGGGAQPSAPQSQATDMQQLLARWYQAAKQMASSDPRLASGANKVAQGIQEMQTALITPQQQTPPSQQPSY